MVSASSRTTSRPSGPPSPMPTPTILPAPSSSVPSAEESVTRSSTSDRRLAEAGAVDALDDGPNRPVGLDGGRNTGANGGHLGHRLREDRSDDVAAEGGLELHHASLAVDLQANAVARQAEAEARRNPGRKVPAVDRGGYEDGERTVSADTTGQEVRIQRGVRTGRVEARRPGGRCPRRAPSGLRRGSRPLGRSGSASADDPNASANSVAFPSSSRLTGLSSTPSVSATTHTAPPGPADRRAHGRVRAGGSRCAHPGPHAPPGTPRAAPRPRPQACRGRRSPRGPTRTS